MDDNLALFHILLNSIEERKDEYDADTFNNEINKIKAIIYEFEHNHFFALLSNEEVNKITKTLFKSIGDNLSHKFKSFESQQKTIDEKYLNEPFWKTIQRIYLKYKFQPNIAYLEYPKSELMEEFVDCFKELDDRESTINFLDRVPIEDREEIIIDILKWGQKYYRGKIFTRKVTDKRKINSDIKQFEKAQQFIESFLPKQTKEVSNTKELNNKILTTTYIHYDGIPYTNTFLLKDVSKKLIELKNDLKNRDFKIFPREYYLDTKLSTKKELEEIFINIAKRYNLKGIKQIEFFLPRISNP